MWPVLLFFLKYVYIYIYIYIYIYKKIIFKQIYSTHEWNPNRMELQVMIMKEYSTLARSPEVESHRQNMNSAACFTLACGWKISVPCSWRSWAIVTFHSFYTFKLCITRVFLRKNSRVVTNQFLHRIFIKTSLDLVCSKTYQSLQVI